MTDSSQGGEGTAHRHPDDLDPGDLVGSTSARLLAAGVGRRERLVALRILGLLADHADAERRVRRPVADLAAEFELPEAALAPALTALAQVGALAIDAERGIVTLAALEGDDRGGLRLDAFLANVGRSFDDDPVTVEAVAERTARTAPRSAPGRRRLVPLVAATAAPVPVAEPATPLHPLTPTSPRRRAVGANPWQRPLRAGAAALVAAAAALVLAAAPGDLRTSTRTLDAAGPADRATEAPTGAPARSGPVPTVRSLEGTTTTTGATTTTRIVGPVGPGPGGAAPAAPGAVGDVPAAVAPGAIAASPGTTAPRTPQAPGTSGSVPPLDEACIPLAPTLQVLGVSDLDRATVGGTTRLSVVRGTVRNPFDEAVVLDGVVVEVVLSDGTTRAVTTATPVAVPAGGTSTWAAEVPLGELADDVTSASASAEPSTWTMAGGGAGAGCGG